MNTSLQQFYHLCENLKRAHKKDKSRLDLCKEHINSLDVKCLCKYIDLTLLSNELLYFTVMKCKNLCNLCIYSNKIHLYNKIKNLKYIELKHIFDLYDPNNNNILQNIIETKSNEISFNDLYDYIDKNSNLNISKYSIDDCINGIKKTNIIEIENSNSYKLFNLILTKKIIVEKYNKDILNFIMYIINKQLIKKFDMKLLKPFFQSDNLLNVSLESRQYDCCEYIIDNSESIYVNPKYFYDIIYLYSYNFKIIGEKLVNLPELVSYKYHYDSHNSEDDSDQFQIHINPSKLIESLFEYNSHNKFIDNVGSLKTETIEYKTDLGFVGIDAGGLTRDFYTQFGIQLKEYFIELDGFLIPDHKKLDLVKWKLLGMIFARSIYYNNISPSINLHPILCFFLVNGRNKFKFSQLINSLLYFDLEFMDNLIKLEKFNDNEYREFLDSMGEEEYISKIKYMMSIIMDKYINDVIINFVNGFRTVSENLVYTQFANIVSLYKFIALNDKYNIKSNSHLSLEQNLQVSIESISSNDEDLQKYLKISGEKQEKIIKKVFIDVLDELNNNDIIKMKKFIKYWFGTNSINNFSNESIKPKLRLSLSNVGYGCFRACTCFTELSVYKPMVLTYIDKYDLMKKCFYEIIDKSLQNQDLMESVGMFMQIA